MFDPDTAIRMIDTAFLNGVAVGVTVGVIATCVISWTLDAIDKKYRKQRRD